MTQADFTIKTESDRPTFSDQLTDADGNVVDLSNATNVWFYQWGPRGQLLINDDTQASITDAVNGKVEYDYTKNQVIRQGSNPAEWKVEFGDGDVQWFPQDRNLEIVVSAPGGDREMAAADLDPEDATVQTLYADSVGTQAGPVGSVYAETAQIDSNESVLVEQLGTRLRTGVLADDGTWYGITTTDDFVKSSSLLDGYETVTSLPFSISGIAGLHMTASGDFVVGASGDIWASSDGGASWTAVQALTVADDSIWGWTENGNGDVVGVQYDDDFAVWQATGGDATTWTKIADDTDLPSSRNTHYHVPAYSPHDDSTFLVTGHFNDPAVAALTRDNGTTWETIDALSPWEVTTTAVAWHPAETDVFFLGSDGGPNKDAFDGIARIRDDGAGGVLETIQNCNSTMGGSGISGSVFSIRVVEHGGEYFYVGATRREGYMGESSPSSDMVVSSLSAEGLRWRGMATVNSGPAVMPTAQGPGEQTLSTSTSPFIPVREQVVSAKDVTNPIYGHTLPKTTFAEGDSIGLWGNADIHFGQYRVSGDNTGNLVIEGGDGNQKITLTSSGRLQLLDAGDSERANFQGDIDLQGNNLRPNGNDDQLNVMGWTFLSQQSATGTAPGDAWNGSIAYFDGDPTVVAEGRGSMGNMAARGRSSTEP